MGKIIAYCRNGCPHSIKASETLERLKNKYNVNIIFIENDEIIKTNLKNKLKEIIAKHDTFPIILYETSKGKLLLVGGNSDLQNIIQLVDKVNSKEDILNLNISDIHKRVLYYMLVNK